MQMHHTTGRCRSRPPLKVTSTTHTVGLASSRRADRHFTLAREIGSHDMANRTLRTLVTLVAACSLTTLTACASSTDAQNGSSDSITGQRIVLLSGSNTNPWSAHFNDTFSESLKTAGATVDERLTADPAEQIQLFNQAISSKPSLIVVQLLDTTAAIASIKKAEAANVPVLVFDGPPDPSVLEKVMTVQSDNTQLGEIAAKNLVEGLKAAGKDSGNYVILAGMNSMILTQQRLQGFEKYMKDYPQYKMLETTDTGWSPETATSQATQLFAKYGDDLHGVYGMADYLALPAIQAAKQAGRKMNADVVVVGGNCFKAGIEAIKQGDYFATGTEDPDTLASETSKYVLQYFSPEKPAQHTTVNEEQITRSNVDQYAEQCSHA